MRVKSLLKSALLAGAAVSVLSVYSCGGGGGGGTEPTATISVTGNAIDGFLFGSNVYADCNGNGVLDKKEPTGFTFGDPVADNDNRIIDLDSNPNTIENYALEMEDTCQGSKLFASGGIDTATQLPFGGVLIGQEGKYNNNITVLTSLLVTADEETQKNIIKNLNLTEDDLGANYVDNDISPEGFQAVVTIASAMQLLTQAMGQIDESVSESIYKNIGKNLADNADIKEAVTEGIIEAIGDKITDNDAFRNSLNNTLTMIIEEIGNATKYNDLGKYAVEDSKIRNISEAINQSVGDIQGYINSPRLDITKVKVVTDNDSEKTDVREDGSFEINVSYRHGDNDTAENYYTKLEVYACFDPQKGFNLSEKKNVDVIVALKTEGRNIDRRTAVLSVKDVNVTLENGNITGVDTKDSFIYLDGIDSTGKRIYRTIYLKGDNDIISYVDVNKIKINMERLLEKVSDAAEGTSLEYIDLESAPIRTGITVRGIPSKPLNGNINLH